MTDISELTNERLAEQGVEVLRRLSRSNISLSDASFITQWATDVRATLRQSHSTGVVEPSDEFIDRLVVQLWRYREIDIDKGCLRMAVTDALRLSPVHKDGEAVAWICDGCGRLSKDPQGDLHALRVSGALSCCPERNLRPLYAHPPKEAEVTVTEEARAK